MILHRKCHDTIKVRGLFSVQITRKASVLQSIPSIITIKRKHIVVKTMMEGANSTIIYLTYCRYF
jgi:hypothetical protein